MLAAIYLTLSWFTDRNGLDLFLKLLVPQEHVLRHVLGLALQNLSEVTLFEAARSGLRAAHDSEALAQFAPCRTSLSPPDAKIKCNRFK